MVRAGRDGAGRRRASGVFRALSPLLFLSAWAPAKAAYAQQTPLPPLVNNSYAIEVWQGPLLAPGHVTGVGGAYIASAEGTEGSAVNVAAPAVRVPYSTSWFEFDLSAGASLTGAFANTDFDNHGDFASTPNQTRAGDFVDFNVGATVQAGYAGAAATGDLQQYSLSGPSGAAPSLTLQLGRWKALAAYGFFGGQLAIGGGARILTMQIHGSGGSVLLTMTGLAPEVGALWLPTDRQFRVGAAFRAGVGGGIFGSDNLHQDAAGVRAAGSFVLPTEVVLPWEVELGGAYQLGPRPLNPGWENPHDQEAFLRERTARRRAAREKLRGTPQGFSAAAEAELRAAEDAELEAESERLQRVRSARYSNWPRERILLLASVLLVGQSSRAVSLEGFLDQQKDSVGKFLTATPRFGMEGEPIQDHLIVRAGTYVEPSRYDGVPPRQHFTFGGDIRLIPLNVLGLFPDAVWKVTMSLDIAPRYTNGGVGIGMWH